MILSFHTNTPANSRYHWNYLHHLWLSLQDSKRDKVFGSCDQAKFSHMLFSPLVTMFTREFTSPFVPQGILATWSPSQLLGKHESLLQILQHDRILLPTATVTLSHSICWRWGHDVPWQCKVFHYGHLTSLRLHLAHKCCSISLKTKYQRICWLRGCITFF